MFVFFIHPSKIKQSIVKCLLSLTFFVSLSLICFTPSFLFFCFLKNNSCFYSQEKHKNGGRKDGNESEFDHDYRGTQLQSVDRRILYALETWSMDCEGFRMVNWSFNNDVFFLINICNLKNWEKIGTKMGNREYSSFSASLRQGTESNWTSCKPYLCGSEIQQGNGSIPREPFFAILSTPDY